MELTKINRVMEEFGVSSRTLRYYEQVGLLWSHRVDSRPDNRAQRYYDPEALERLRQIVILRKMQIPVKEIAAVFENGDMAGLLKAFADKLEALDMEITALKELRELVDEFTRKMLCSGVTKISAIPLLYEETERRLSFAGKEAVSFEQLSEISHRALRLGEVRLIRLPAMGMLTSQNREGALSTLDGGTMQNLFEEYGLMPTPGMRDCFYTKEPGEQWMMRLRLPGGFQNTSPYREAAFSGGLYAVCSASMETMDEMFVLLREWVANSEEFQPDSARQEMIEEILPWDIATRQQRYQQDLFVPIKEKSKEGPE